MTNAPISTRIIIFAKTPTAGTVKTRLIPTLGAAGAARLASHMLTHTVAQALTASANDAQLTVELCVAPDPEHSTWQWAADHPAIRLSGQARGDLGQRLFSAAQRASDDGERVIAIGTDCPAITAGLLQRAAAALRQRDAVICPTLDGGYALLGLRRCDAHVFSGIPWSTDRVAAITLARLAALGYTVETLARLRDIDEADDLRYVPPSWLTAGEPLDTRDSRDSGNV